MSAYLRENTQDLPEILAYVRRVRNFSLSFTICIILTFFDLPLFPSLNSSVYENT